jgi:hypothetical protein
VPVITDITFNLRSYHHFNSSVLIVQLKHILVKEWLQKYDLLYLSIPFSSKHLLISFRSSRFISLTSHKYEVWVLNNKTACTAPDFHCWSLK